MKKRIKCVNWEQMFRFNEDKMFKIFYTITKTTGGKPFFTEQLYLWIDLILSFVSIHMGT